jgi:isopenicillin-N epimerase
MNRKIKKLFLIDPGIHYLNHGSFGACPKPVFQEYQKWQRAMEIQPVKFLGRHITLHMEKSREKLAEYIICQADELVYFSNPTTAINMVVRSLALKPGDEILATNHEYGAMDRTWKYITGKISAKYKNHPISIPVTTKEDFVDNIWSGVTEKTKVIFLSHITSPTALTFPVKEVCKMARLAGILSIVDGAHVSGHIDLDVSEIGADIYVGVCHKWLCAPKGSAFLYTRKEAQPRFDPLVISWGYEAEEPSPSQFIDNHEWQGTRDMSAFLSVPAAIEFQKDYNWKDVRKKCNNLLIDAIEAATKLTGIKPISPYSGTWFNQMAAIQLPELDTKVLQRRLYGEFKVEVPVYIWNDKPFLRISVQGYNDKRDTDALIRGLEVLLPETINK